ncbi:Lsr2 protein [Branchiibius hedensis]|uniref:Lsr2 protein n=1 Tax=Branchiibius hedensis TaxID=672460 RepID=A0A2Y9BPY0_9MICO|nr:histone-like nucleoid-structuring protein Lsr2 [Branchiibius hedensis]PWJ23303.1 Lsr2 protein [Branchiibius hedensis]SSA58992.1 Lsr2 protein [Branchiibius hedensis]
MSTQSVTNETTLTVVKHLINGRDDTFIATATGLTVTAVQDIKISHGYPDLSKMEWSRDILERRINEPAASAALPSPTIRSAAPPADPRGTTRNTPRPTDPRPTVVSAREVKPSANELIVVASNSPKARTRALGVKVAALIGDLSQRLAAEERERVAQAAEKAANAKRLQRIEELEAELKKLRAKTRSTKTAPPLGAPAAKVREWASQQGIGCPAYGKIPNTVRDAYDAAHAAA